MACLSGCLLVTSPVDLILAQVNVTSTLGSATGFVKVKNLGLPSPLKRDSA